jgi:hypothetical protein
VANSDGALERARASALTQSNEDASRGLAAVRRKRAEQAVARGELSGPSQELFTLIEAACEDSAALTPLVGALNNGAEPNALAADDLFAPRLLEFVAEDQSPARCSAIVFAIRRRGSLPVITALLEAGADTNLRAPSHPLHAAASGCLGVEHYPDERQIIEALLRAGADVDGRGRDAVRLFSRYRPGDTYEGSPPLFGALENSAHDIAMLLVARGASPTLTDQAGRTAASTLLETLLFPATAVELHAFVDTMRWVLSLGVPQDCVSSLHLAPEERQFHGILEFAPDARHPLRAHLAARLDAYRKNLRNLRRRREEASEKGAPLPGTDPDQWITPEEAESILAPLLP